MKVTDVTTAFLVAHHWFDQFKDFFETRDLLMIHFGCLPGSPNFKLNNSDLFDHDTEWIAKISMLGLAVHHYWLRKPDYDLAVFNLQKAGNECAKVCRRFDVDPLPVIEYLHDLTNRSKLKGAVDTLRNLEVVAAGGGAPDDKQKPDTGPVTLYQLESLTAVSVSTLRNVLRHKAIKTAKGGKGAKNQYDYLESRTALIAYDQELNKPQFLPDSYSKAVQRLPAAPTKRKSRTS